MLSTLRTTSLLTVAALGGMTGVGLADAPEQVVETIPFTIPVWADCSEHGGEGIVAATGTIDRRVQVGTDRDGTQREVRHVHFVGTLTGPAGTATYEGSFRALFEDPEGLFVRTGHVTFHLPGAGAPFVSAGRQVVRGDEPEVATAKAASADNQAAVCAALAA